MEESKRRGDVRFQSMEQASITASRVLPETVMEFSKTVLVTDGQDSAVVNQSVDNN